MSKRLKFWTGLGVTALSGALVAQAAGFGHPQQLPAQHGKLLQLADASGEAGESGSAGMGGGDRVDYLMDLALLEGRMLAAAALARGGEADQARKHVTHAGDEAFADLKGHFDIMKVPGFAAELDAAARAIESGSGDIDAAMDKLLAAIAAARGGPMTAAEAVQAAVLVLHNAADEFASSIAGGHVRDAHEYQDAWGFLQSAKRLIAALSDDEREEHMGPLGDVDAALAMLDGVFADFTGKSTKVEDPSIVAGAVARIELAASAIK
jgi:hypothetical protein